MLNFKTLSFLFGVFFFGNLLSLMVEAAYLGDSDVTLVNQLMGFNVSQLAGSSGILALPRIGVGVMTTALPKVISWDYAFFTGEWQLVRWLLFFLFSAPTVLVLAFTFMPSLMGVVSRVFRLGDG